MRKNASETLWNFARNTNLLLWLPLHFLKVKEPKSWRKLYFRTKGEIEQAKVEAAQRIKDKYAQHRAEKDAKKLVVSDRPLMTRNARSGADASQYDRRR